MGKAESRVEHYLDAQVRQFGGITRKLRWIGRNGAPDRVVFINGNVIFVEIKSETGKLSAVQQAEIREIAVRGGVQVHLASSMEEVDALLENFVIGERSHGNTGKGLFNPE